MSNPNDGNDSNRKTGWEKADAVAHGAGRAVHGIAWVLTKCWGIALIIIGIAVMIGAAATAWWVALILIAYGIYLVAPGSKFVVW